jgi:hypothetical protein
MSEGRVRIRENPWRIFVDARPLGFIREFDKLNGARK